MTVSTEMVTLNYDINIILFFIINNLNIFFKFDNKIKEILNLIFYNNNNIIILYKK